MVNAIAHLIGELLGSVLGLVFVACFLTAVFFWPILAWMLVRHVRGIHHELRRMNDAGTPLRSEPVADLPLRPAPARQASLGHQLLR